MRNWIASLLLALGTCLSGVGAASSERASLELVLPAEGGLEGQYLFRSHPTGEGGEDLAAGTELTAGVVARLRAWGEERVLVRNPPVGSETLPLAAAEGRVLAGPVGEYAAGRFLEERAVADLAEAGVEEVEVSISRAFSFGGWKGRTLFLGGVVAMVVGVVVMRTGSAVRGDEALAGGQVGPDRLRTMLGELHERVGGLAARVDELDCDAIQAELEPLFVDYGQPFVDHREALRTAFGGAVFANVLAPFAAAERRLNRSWSAAVDGYREEARASVHAAVAPLAEAREAFPRA